MKALTVCVQYDDLLALTLPKNLRRLDRVVVVTSPADRATVDLVENMPGPVYCHQTDAFYRHGAEFNKGAAIEEALDRLGRDGWIMLLDADTVLPDRPDFRGIEPGKFYCPRRHWCLDAAAWNGSFDWSAFRVPIEKDMGGYCCFFHADDPVLATRPWYPTNWRHAGGADTIFNHKWPKDRRRRPDWHVLHLGPTYENWYGRTSPRLDGSMPAGHETRAGKIQQMHRDRASGYGFSREKVR